MLGELERRGSTLARVIEYAPSMIVIGDGARLHYCNAAFCDLLGYAREEITARPVFEFVHPEDLATQNQAIKEIDGRTVEGVPLRYLRADGTAVLLRWTGADLGGGLKLGIAEVV